MPRRWICICVFLKKLPDASSAPEQKATALQSLSYFFAPSHARSAGAKSQAGSRRRGPLFSDLLVRSLWSQGRSKSPPRFFRFGHAEQTGYRAKLFFPFPFFSPFVRFAGRQRWACNVVVACILGLDAGAFLIVLRFLTGVVVAAYGGLWVLDRHSCRVDQTLLWQRNEWYKDTDLFDSSMDDNDAGN